MENKTLIKFALIGLPIIIYVFYTIHYSCAILKNRLLTKKQKKLNLILIWLVPFVWILFLKTFFKPNPGSHQVKNKRDPKSFTESGLGMMESPTNDHH